MMMKIPAVLACLPCLLAATLAAQDFSPDHCAETVEAARKAQGIPGMSAAIGFGGKLIWTRGFGKADIENDVPATKDTVFRLASISKPITAVAVMQLVERGKIDLDKPVREYVPTFPKKKWPLSCRHLLSHVGGVRHYKPGEILSTKHYSKVEDALVIFQEDPLRFEPGTRYSYTTYGYNVLGAVVARASGRRFVDYLRKNVFEPANMTNAQADDSFRIIKHRAQGYRKTVLGALRNSAMVDTSNKMPGGGLCSTATDLVEFGQALMAGKLVKPETVRQMWTQVTDKDGKPVPGRNGRPARYGLGFSLMSRQGPRSVGHGGAQPRVRTLLVIRPDEGVVVSLMSNLEGSRLNGIARDLGKHVVETLGARKSAMEAAKKKARNDGK